LIILRGWIKADGLINVDKNTILFDLGETLAHYYVKSEFPGILQQAISEVRSYLGSSGLLTVTPELIQDRARDENHESTDYRSRPLEDRLIRVFELDASITTDELLMEMCQCFMKPIFARGRCYEDTLPVLRELKSRGFRTAIVSNSPWGSPSMLWRSEIERLGLGKYVDRVVLDRDVGWRKPAKSIFEYTMNRLQANPPDCVFVGDDSEWDVKGPNAAGIEAILIARHACAKNLEHRVIKSLHELPDML
jgi:HAD superfamily hydrolase (TIGR01509 family)